MSVRIIEGNLFDTGAKYIGHQVNCQGVMGSGVAKQVKQRYPSAYAKYKHLCDWASEEYDRKEVLLGTTQNVIVGDKVILNIFAQDHYGRDGRCYTDYTAFRKCMQEIRSKVPQGSKIAFPYRIGCGLAGGDWDKVLSIVNDILSDEYEIEFWKYKND